ncbi:hypothetical protein ACFQ21_05210 [Ohtaekwangia kribbensis]|uniref:Uncharacterized protein n=1 Tax=Ohtaekwangia kribbensis TaxID=688913 RepID=A0ABW3JXW6_9BACT
MGRTKRKKGKKSKKRGGLSGITGAITKGNNVDALKTAGGILLAGIAGGITAAAVGKISLLASIPVLFIGAKTENKFILAAGASLAVTSVVIKKPTSVSGVDGFDFKQIAEDAKDRVGQFFENFKEKLYIPASKSEGTNGLYGGEQVKYFINPYNSNDDGMSELDRVNDDVLAMNEGTAGLFDIDREL